MARAQVQYEYGNMDFLEIPKGTEHLFDQDSDLFGYWDQPESLYVDVLTHRKAVLLPQFVPWYEQKSKVTCVPATWRSVLESTIDLSLSEKKLIKVLNTDLHEKKGGTRDKDLKKFLRTLDDLEFYREKHGSYEQVAEALLNGWVVVPEFLHPEDDIEHVAVLRGISPAGVALLDPYSGPYCALTWDEFRWRSDKKSKDRPFWAARKRL